jgi:hypothetical protein
VNAVMNLPVPQSEGNLLSEGLLACQQGLYSMELVIISISKTNIPRRVKCRIYAVLGSLRLHSQGVGERWSLDSDIKGSVTPQIGLPSWPRCLHV